MSKHSTGAIHHFTAFRIDINSLVRLTHTRARSTFKSGLEWHINGKGTSSIEYLLSLEPENRYLQLFYTNIDYKGNKTEINYKINIVGVKSNLGKGENLYFICPLTSQRCKILYQCYDSKYFMSRKAYTSRIYYTSQMYSKVDRVYNYYFELNNRINEIESKSLKSHYRGEPTKTQNLLSTLKRKRENFDNLRWSNFVKNTETLPIFIF